jgi:hypothetical protein
MLIVVLAFVFGGPVLTRADSNSSADFNMARACRPSENLHSSGLMHRSKFRHSITASAVASSVGGTSRSSALGAQYLLMKVGSCSGANYSSGVECTNHEVPSLMRSASVLVFADRGPCLSAGNWRCQEPVCEISIPRPEPG